MKKIFLIILCIVYCALCIDLNAQEYTTPKREFRGAWLSTVWAIDWPGNKANNLAGDPNIKEIPADVVAQTSAIYKECEAKICHK